MPLSRTIAHIGPVPTLAQARANVRQAKAEVDAIDEVCAAIRREGRKVPAVLIDALNQTWDAYERAMAALIAAEDAAGVTDLD